jgi:hypothetical protein
MNRNARMLILLGTAIFSLLFSGCEKEHGLELPGQEWGENTTSSRNKKPLYLFSLENKFKNKNGTYTWIWSVSNAKPGDGTPASGTAQDLKSWGITLGSCATPGHIISGSTSPDGISWTNFTPEIKSEVSSSLSNPVIMFQQGTVRNQKSYYKLVVTQNYSVNQSVSAFYQSGDITGNGVITVSGFGCPLP